MVDGLAYSLGLAVDWLVDIAQVKGERLTVEKTKHVHAYWKGAIRGEYGLASKQWGFFCPCWHTGQAIKALAMASTIDGSRGTKALAGAKEGAGFLMANQVWDEKSEDHGLILAYEDYPDLVNVSAILESCDGLLVLSDVSGEKR